MKRHKKSDYEVGYQRPPEHSRFKKGQSGNPAGRPKGSLSVAAALNRASREMVTVIENGRTKQITKLDATIKALVNRAVKGDAKAVQQMLALSHLVGVEAPDAAGLGATDAAVMASLVKRLRTESEEDPKSESESQSSETRQ